MWLLKTAAFTSETLNLEKYLPLLTHWAVLVLFSLPFVHLGYRIRLGSSTDKKDTGRLHVDFAQARDDLYEWECKQRMLAREERHRRRMEEERLHPPSPPPVVHYSDHECSIVAEKLKGIESTWASWLKELFPLRKFNKYICTIGNYPLNFPLTGSKHFLCHSLTDREVYPVTEELERFVPHTCVSDPPLSQGMVIFSQHIKWLGWNTFFTLFYIREFYLWFMTGDL